MTYSNDNGGRSEVRAAIFIDYENIYQTLAESLDGEGNPDELIGEMIDALQRSLLEERQTRTAVARAYADFAALSDGGDGIQRSLYARGVEPLFVPRSLDVKTAELQLCVDAMDLLHHRSDIAMFVLLTGRRTYLPLVQTFKRYGRRVLVVAAEETQAVKEGAHIDAESFFPARDLLSTSSRRVLLASEPGESEKGEPQDAKHRTIEDPVLIRTLQIIERHFGQYEEVFLTPLLRKMSEVLDDKECDPKEIVSDLEEHDAVRLEKRRGDPHNYTVLILQNAHPDVMRVKEDLRAAREHAPGENGQQEKEAYVDDHRGDGA